MKCHGADGTGNKTRDRLPEIPDFSDTRWQTRRADAQLMASILDGKGDDMPPQRGKISDEQARDLVGLRPRFRPDPGKTGTGRTGRARLGRASGGRTTKGFFAKLIRWLGRFHPPAVHFPIALLTAAAVAEILVSFRRFGGRSRAARRVKFPPANRS